MRSCWITFMIQSSQQHKTYSIRCHDKIQKSARCHFMIYCICMTYLPQISNPRHENPLSTMHCSIATDLQGNETRRNNQAPCAYELFAIKKVDVVEHKVHAIRAINKWYTKTPETYSNREIQKCQKEPLEAM